MMVDSAGVLRWVDDEVWWYGGNEEGCRLADALTR